MARNDFIPNAQNDFLAWHDNFKAQTTALMATLGLTQTEVDAVATDNTNARNKALAADTAQAASKAATADYRATARTVETNARNLARRIKTHPSYTEAIGQQLGIVGPEDTTDLSQAKPTLKLESVAAGAVTIGFQKSVADGVWIYSRRGSEGDFSPLALDLFSPYVDNRSNLTASPESREYIGYFVQNDQLIGNASDALRVTVPV